MLVVVVVVLPMAAPSAPFMPSLWISTFTPAESESWPRKTFTKPLSVTVDDVPAVGGVSTHERSTVVLPEGEPK